MVSERYCVVRGLGHGVTMVVDVGVAHVADALRRGCSVVGQKMCPEARYGELGGAMAG